jgi:AAA domain
MNRALRPDREIPAGYVPLESAEPWERCAPDIGQSAGARSRFILEPWSAITFDGREEWLVKRVLPRKGVAVIYGKPASLKTFIAFHVALSCGVNWAWAGRSVSKAPVVYIAAEGAAGLRKRKAGYAKAYPDLPVHVDFALISAAPNLGAEPGDLPALTEAIDRADVSPGLIVLDTLAQALGGSDENGAGMTAFLANAGKLAEHFHCLVLIVHHVGHADDRRMRGHSSLGGGIDAQILCERPEGALEATLTVIKLKDDASDVRFVARLSRIVLGHDEDGDEISTLIVESVEEAQVGPSAPATKSVPKSLRLLMDVVAEVLSDAGRSVQAFGASGPRVRAVAEQHIRKRYFDRVAEQAEPDEDKAKLYDRRRQAFKRAIKTAIDAKLLIADDQGGERVIWFP